MTTKAQEQAALDQIRAILATLEHGSYARRAFEGCSELAQENIDNDWTTSMKELRDTAETRAEAQANAKVAERMKRLEAALLSPNDLAALHFEMYELAERLTARRDAAKEAIVQHADDPDLAPFCNARGEYHWATRELERANGLLESLETAQERYKKL